MIVYADILFAVNFLMDALVLYAVNKVYKQGATTFRIISGAFLGAVYAVIKLFVNTPEPLVAVIVSVIMVFIAFGKSKASVFIKKLITFYAMSMLLGGLVSVLYSACANLYRPNAFRIKIGIKHFVFAFLISFVFIKLFSGILHTARIKKTRKAVLVLEGKQKELSLLVDSGNMLCDPYTSKPVIILSQSVLDSMLGNDGVHKYIYKQKYPFTDERILKYKPRCIPITTASGKSMLVAISPEKIALCSEKGEQMLDALIACEGERGVFGENDGIIPYSLVCNL